MKYEWRKQEKELYLPKQTPTIVEIPAMQFLTIIGTGDPNTSENYPLEVAALYAVSYALRMKLKKTGFEYVVYPLEGVWTTSDGSRDEYLNKDAFKYKLMIRQPQQVSSEDIRQAIQDVSKKKPNVNYLQLAFEQYEEGACLQMLHVGPYDNERQSFQEMKKFLQENNLSAVSTMENYPHREIYLSDPRKVAPEKLKTVLRLKLQLT